MATEMARLPERNYNSRSIRPANSLQEAIRNTLPFPRTSLQTATEAATLIVEQVPAGRPPNPETYIGSIVAILAEYPPELVAKISDPVHGIVRRTGFLPNLKELSEALESEMQPLRRRWQHERELREQQARAAAPLAIHDASARDRVRRQMEQLSAELAAAPDPVPPKFRRDGPAIAPASARVAAVLAKAAQGGRE